MGYEYERVTIEDCLDMYEKKNMYVVLNSGEVEEFEKEV